MKQTQHKLETILSQALQEDKLSTEDIIFLLSLDNADQINKLFAAAKSLRRKYFGDKIFLYGFIYASTYCRNDCRFCYFRRSNTESQRYRKAKPEIVTAAHRLAESGVHLIDLTMGEDPALYNSDGAGFERLNDLVDSIRRATGRPIMVSPGVIPDHVLSRLAETGASWYACYQETHRRNLFNQLRPGQDFDLRLETKINAHHLGLLIEEGLLCGVGETAGDIAHSIDVMHQLDADQVRVMNFVPQPGTPMAKRTPPDPRREMLISAVMRLAFQDRLIPASLDVDGLAGLKRRLAAGANVVTSIVPPGEGLAGVAQHSLDIEDGRRTNASVLKVLDKCSLRPATNEEYQNWIRCRRQAITNRESDREVAC
ncbi:MAG: methylornithine synthase PylB [Desulfobacterales bacterium]|nr:MAG: methylornithine synthase PylB [Desulfobacterales bacterium]